MKKFFNIYTVIFCTLLFTLVSCDPEAVYNLKNVKIDINVSRLSSGYAYVTYHTSKPAYFVIGIEKMSNQDIINHPSQYMTLVMDSVYIDYVQWRHSYLKDGEENIAGFSSHSLEYSSSMERFYPLDEDSDYWLYAFVVDPNTKQPVGNLVKQKLHTMKKVESEVHCNIRMDGSWLYTYPKGRSGLINDYCPYFWTTISDESLQESFHGSAREFLREFFKSVDQSYYKNVSSFGVDVYNDAEIEYFKVNEDYHFISCTLDGEIGNMVHYKFTYNGIETMFEKRYPDDNIEENIE